MPHDATIQLAVPGRRFVEPPSDPEGPEGSEGPVFVDESGRRSKTYRRVGWVLAAVCAVYAVTLVVALLGGNSSAPWLPISGQEEKRPGEVEVQPAPTDPTGSVTDTPGLGPSASASDPASTGTLPQSGRTTGRARPGEQVSASLSAVPPTGDGESSDPAPETQESPPPVVETSPPVADSASPVEEEPPAGTDPAEEPHVQGQEGAL